MYERIEKLRKNKGLTVRKVEEDNGFSNGSLKKSVLKLNAVGFCHYQNILVYQWNI